MKPKRRGIMMTTLMMQALERNEKFETRRLSGFDLINEAPDDWNFRGYHVEPDLLGREVVRFKNSAGEDCRVKCRYGSAGHLLYTRETFCLERKFPLADLFSHKALIKTPIYKSDKLDHVAKLMRWTPAIHQPEIYSRFNLLIKNVYCERLADITEESAIAEGVLKNEFGFFNYYKNLYCLETAVESYMTLIGTIHGRKTVELNPWLWRIIFQPSKII